MTFSRNEIFDGHFAGGKCAGLVEADTIDASESLNRVEVLHKDFLATEANGGEGEDARSEQDKPLGNHIDKCCNSASDGYFWRAIWNAEPRPEKKGANRNKGKRDVFDDVVHDGKEFRIGGLDGVGGRFKLTDEIFRTDSNHGSFAGAGDDKATRDEFISGVLEDVI